MAGAFFKRFKSVKARVAETATSVSDFSVLITALIPLIEADQRTLTIESTVYTGQQKSPKEEIVIKLKALATRFKETSGTVPADSYKVLDAIKTYVNELDEMIHSRQWTVDDVNFKIAEIDGKLTELNRYI